jgi:hypothetical protein
MVYKTTDGDDTFRRSKGWLANFKQQIQICNIKLTDEAASADEEAARVYPEHFLIFLLDRRHAARQTTPLPYLKKNLKSLKLLQRWQIMIHSQGNLLVSNAYIFIFYYRINVI